jgi:hypothetical protein
MKRTMEAQNDEDLPRWIAEREALTTQAANLSAALRNGTLGPAAMSHLSRDLEALYGQADALTAKIEARETELAALTPPDTAAQLAADWKHAAHVYADPSQPVEHRQAWAAAHIHRVMPDGSGGWRVQFAVFSQNPHSGCQLPWLCEIVAYMPGRAA